MRVFASQEPPSGTPVAPSAEAPQGLLTANNGTIRLPGLLVLTDGATPGRRQSNQSLGAAPSHNHPGGWYASYPGPDREALWGGPGGCACQPEPGALLNLALFVSERFRLALFCAAPRSNQKADCPSLATIKFKSQQEAKSCSLSPTANLKTCFLAEGAVGMSLMIPGWLRSGAP